MIGRWSELRVVRVRCSESKAMWKEAIVRSGEVGSLREGRRVGESRLKRRRSEFVYTLYTQVILKYELAMAISIATQP